jgi:cellulose synthase/poly-beta-1,6-N-acetylglucosamine synthase-like glycosyltransferase
MKRCRIYVIIVLAWLALLTLFFNELLAPLYRAFLQSPFTFYTVLASTLFIAYFWLNGLKDVIYTAYFYIYHSHRLGTSTASTQPQTPLVELIYCTHNDFTPESLLASMKQDYPNYKVIILDDSDTSEKLAEVAAFGNLYTIQVVRRDSRQGHKAGNLNNYLQNCTADFFVVLDSDEIIPPDFITKALPYFQDPRIAVMQGNHVATNNQNAFMRRFSDGVESHWHTYQNIKDDFGFLSFLGHGAMIRTSAYKEVGGFPELVAEDLCFSIELREKGYFVAFAHDIVCYEQYPVSYEAFKKRHSKWTQGNMEFIRSYTLKLITSKMHWYEKLDLVLFTYSLPLSVIFSVYLVINIIIFPLIHFDPKYPADMLLPTILFLLAPMCNDLLYYSIRRNPFKLFFYAFCLILLYGSLFYVSF